MAELMLVNPRKRRRRRTTARRRPIRRRSTSVTRSVTRRYRRNPQRNMPKIVDQVRNAAVGAVGAFAVDVAMAKLPIPAQFKTGMMAPAAQGVISIGIGMLVATNARSRKMGVALAEGGLTVALHGVMKKAAGPTFGLADIGDDLLSYGDDLLAYEPVDNMGFYNPAPGDVVQDYDMDAYEDMD